MLVEKLHVQELICCQKSIPFQFRKASSNALKVCNVYVGKAPAYPKLAMCMREGKTFSVFGRLQRVESWWINIRCREEGLRICFVFHKTLPLISWLSSVLTARKMWQAPYRTSTTVNPIIFCGCKRRQLYCAEHNVCFWCRKMSETLQSEEAFYNFGTPCTNTSPTLSFVPCQSCLTNMLKFKTSFWDTYTFFVFEFCCCGNQIGLCALKSHE